MKFHFLGLGILTGLLLLHSSNHIANARPKLAVVFSTLYEVEFAGNPEARSCRVCHEGNADKRPQNSYGKAVGASLEVKNVTDLETLIAALRKTEDKPSDIPDKTFGDLIREGRLPASKP